MISAYPKVSLKSYILDIFDFQTSKNRLATLTRPAESVSGRSILWIISVGVRVEVGRAGLVGVVFVPLLGGLGGRVVVLAALREGLVAAVHARRLHGRRGRAAAQQVGEAAQGRQRAEGPEGAGLGQELREGDGGGQGTRGRPSSGRAPGGATLQVRLL